MKTLKYRVNTATAYLRRMALSFLTRDKTGKRYARYLPTTRRRIPVFVDRFVRAADYRVSQGEDQLITSMRLNMELAFAGASVRGNAKWRERVVLAGVLAATMDDDQVAAAWLSAGLAMFDSKVLARGRTYGFGASFTDWLDQVEGSLASEAAWSERLAQAQTHDARHNMLCQLCVVLSLLGLKKVAVTILGAHVDPRAYGSTYVNLYNRLPRTAVNRYSPSEIFDEDPRDIRYKVLSNTVVTVFKPIPGARKRPDLQPVSLFASAEADWISRADQAEIFDAAEFNLIAQVFHHIANGKVALANKLIEPVLARRENRSYLSALHEGPGPVRLFLGGYGWTGSSAVFDGFLGFPNVREMPGAGVDAPFLNDGADSEPMLHQGPTGLKVMLQKMSPAGRIPTSSWQSFYRLYVLTGAHRSYFEYKTVWAARNMRRRLGVKRYYLLILDALYHYTRWYGTSQGKNMTRMALKRLEDSFVRALYPNPSDVVLFNNSVSAENVSLLKHIPGRKIYIAVNRKVQDQFADQKRFNRFLDTTAAAFAQKKLSKLRAFHAATRGFNSEKVKIYNVMFEDWILDDTYRQTITEDILGEYSREHERKGLKTEVSAQNINMFQNYLSDEEIKTLSDFQRAHKDWPI